MKGLENKVHNCKIATFFIYSTDFHARKFVWHLFILSSDHAAHTILIGKDLKPCQEKIVVVFLIHTAIQILSVKNFRSLKMPTFLAFFTMWETITIRVKLIKIIISPNVGVWPKILFYKNYWILLNKKFRHLISKCFLYCVKIRQKL